MVETGDGRAIRGGFGCRPENLTHVEGTVGGMWKLMKKGAEMMRQKEIKKGMQCVQPTPGRYRIEQDHRTRPLRSPRKDRTSMRETPDEQVQSEFGFACGGLLLHAESCNCRKGSDDRVRGFPQQRVVFLRCDVGAAVRAA